MYRPSVVFILGLALSTTALANEKKEPTVKKSGVIDITPKSVYFKISAFRLEEKDDSFLRVVGILGTDFILVPDRLSGHIELHVGPTNAAFTKGVGESLSVQSTWGSDAIASMLLGTRLTLFRRSFIEVEAYVSFESSMFNQKMNAKNFAFTSDDTEYDISDFAKEHTSVSLGWSRWLVGLDVRVPIWIFVPSVSFGFEKHTFIMDLDIDDEGNDLIRSLGENPSSVSKTYDVEYYVPTLGFGTDIEIPKLPFVITADIKLIPVNIEQLFLSASLGIALEF